MTDLFVIVGGIFTGMGATASWHYRRLSRCTSCIPHCPNGHKIQLRGMASLIGISFGAMSVLAWLAAVRVI